MARQNSGSRTGLTFLLCVLTAMFEGADNLSLGLAAPRLAPEFHLHPQQIGLALSASLIGLMLGASVAGRLSDRFGRKALLVASMLLLGGFSLATVVVNNLSMLVLIRFLAGIGLGGAFPTLIAISAESSKRSLRGLAISVVYAGQPIGGSILSLIFAAYAATMGWRGIFIIGGVGPLVMAPLLALLLPEPADFRAARQGPKSPDLSVAATLFGEGRARVTLLLWISCLFTLFMVYLMLNWIPSLMVGKGLTHPQASIATMALTLGNAVGTLAFGVALDRANRRWTIIVGYTALLASLVVLTEATGFQLLVLSSGVVGFFMLGCQVILYTICADYYPTLGRGTGVGSTVAVGRIGAVLAPLAGGALLEAGVGPSAVIGAMIPCALIAAASAVALSLRPAASPASAAAV